MRFNENKMWYKTIPEILDYIKDVSKIPFIVLDTETTGLLGSKEEQLTQISAISSNYNIILNEFEELSKFDEKIKLNKKTKDRYSKPDDNTRRILSFNHYGAGNYKYKEEKDIVDIFFNWIEEYSPCLIIAQNSKFDMNMLCGRFGHKINYEVFDTKMLIQLYLLPLILTLAETDKVFKSMVNNIGVSQRDNGLISSSLSRIGPALGLNMSGYHDAISDVRITMKMIQKIVELLKEYKDVDIRKYQNERIKNIRLK